MRIPARCSYSYLCELLLLMGVFCCKNVSSKSSSSNQSSDSAITVDILSWTCHEPIFNYFLALLNNATADNYESPASSRSNANFYADASLDELHVSPNLSADIDSVFLQMQSCTNPDPDEPGGDCGQFFGLGGHYGIFKLNPNYGYTINQDEGSWCNDKGFPLYFAGVKYFKDLGKTVAIHLQDSGKRPSQPVRFNDIYARVMAMDFAAFEVSEDCTYDTLPCEGDLILWGQAARVNDVPPDAD